MISKNLSVVVVIVILLGTLQACSGVHLRYHDYPGDRSALKVFPFWEDGDGDKHLVGGLNVVLYARDKGEVETEDLTQVTTDTETPPLFENLDPGSYRLRVFLDEDTHVSEKLDLLPGKRLTVKVNVIGIKKNEHFAEAVGDFFVGAFVMIGKISIEIAIDSLIFDDDDNDDDDDFFGNRESASGKAKKREKKEKAIDGIIDALERKK